MAGPHTSATNTVFLSPPLTESTTSILFSDSGSNQSRRDVENNHILVASDREVQSPFNDLNDEVDSVAADLSSPDPQTASPAPPQLRTSKTQIPTLYHSALDAGKFSILLHNHLQLLSSPEQTEFHPFPSESYAAFMHLVKDHPKIPDSFWKDLLKWFQSRPKPVDAKELPKTLAEGLALVQQDSPTKKIGDFVSHTIGTMKDGTIVQFRCRDIMDCLFELLVEFFELMVFEYDERRNSEGNRVYGEFNTGNWWKKQSESLPALAKLLAIMVYSDATQLDGGGKVSEHPIYLTLSNIPLEFRNKPKTKVLVGFLEKPWGKLGRSERDSDAHRGFIRDMYHSAYQVLFMEIKKYQERGFYFVLGMEIHHFVPRMACFPGDMQEHYIIARGGSPASKSPCNECMVQIHFLHMTAFGDEAGDDELARVNHVMIDHDNTLKPRTEARMKSIADSGNKAAIKAASFHPGLNAFSGFILSPLYESIPSDYMMHGIAGINKHIFDNLIIFLDANYKKKASEEIQTKVGQRFRAMPRIDSRRLPTNSVMDSTSLSSKEREAITLFLVFAVHGLLEDRHMSLFAAMLIPHLKWQKLCSSTEICEVSMGKIAELTEEFCLAFVDVYGQLGSELQIPKLHMLVHHLTDSIQRFGVPMNWVTSMFEHFHHFIKNDYKCKSNKRDVIGGLISCNSRRIAFSFLDTTFDEHKLTPIKTTSTSNRFIGQRYSFSVLQRCHANKKIESLSLTPRGHASWLNACKELNEVEESSLFKRASLGPTMQSTLKDINTILEHVYIRLNQTDGILLDDSESEPEFNLDDLQAGIEYRYFKFHNSVIPAGTWDKYNASPSSYNYTRFSNVQLYQHENSTITDYVKILALVSISAREANSGKIAAGSAWVQYYEQANPTTPQVYGCPYLKLSSTKRLIGVEEFKKEVLMVPDFHCVEQNPIGPVLL
ncbi:hypothetical protein BDR26DRAFT_961495 [Obelidium mucronatum]|nr:hypothetical protein BDR26DRAFT_961495 [Obelidium mucronatum]